MGSEDNDELNKILNSNANISKCSVTVPENLEDLGCFIAMMKDNENLKNIIDEVIDVWKKDLLDELMNSNNISIEDEVIKK